MSENKIVETKVAASSVIESPETILRRTSPQPPPRYVPAEEDLSVFKRFSPTRSRWPEVGRFDERVRELEERAGSLNEELAALATRLREAKEADREALADWQQADGTGRRPEPSAPAIGAEIEARTADREAALVACERVLEAKARFVEKNRVRLVRDADRATKEAQKRYMEAIAALEEARTELVEARAAALWAALFPGPLATTAPPTQALVGGLRRPVEAAPGVPIQVQVNGVFRALRSDADFLAEAMTRDHALELGAADPQRHKSVWMGTPEGQKQLEQERREALERYKAMWGQYPA